MRRVVTKLVLGLVLVIPVVGMTQVAASDASLEEFLNEFHQDPASVMKRLPAEIGPNGEVIERGEIPELDSAEAEALLEQRRFSREWVVKRSAPLDQPMIFAPPLERDLPQAVVHDKRVINNIHELHNNGWSSGKPSFIPWADSYWPRYKGVIGHRYADPGYPNSGFVSNSRYYQSNPPANFIPEGISKLSPSEKYDLLIGDSAWSLTQSAWAVGHESLQRWGSVPSWEGICHGWAAVSHMGIEPPLEPVTVTGVNGHAIPFRESDIKGLLSYLWAEVYIPTNYSGHVCRKEGRAIERDETGRVIDAECFNTNPSSWHLLVSNQVGRLGKSFVADVNWDSAIWNYPIASYSSSYFNPQTKRPTSSLNAAIVPIEQFRLDKFKKYRHPNTKYVVGVAMTVEHPEAVQPTLGAHPEAPRMNAIRWVYDLELDRDHNIIGGEWYSTAHPDFMWSFDSEAKPNSEADKRIQETGATWAKGTPLPAGWAEAARGSALNGEPARLIVERLRDLSRGIEDSVEEEIEVIEEPEGEGPDEREPTVEP